MSALDLERQRDLGEILSTCLALYAKHFLLFATLALAIVLPVDLVLDGVAAQKLWSGYDSTPPIGVAIAGFPVATLVVLPLISANHARAVIALGDGTVPAIGRTLLEGLRLLPAVALVVLLYDLGSFGGLLLLLIPGFYLYVVCLRAGRGGPSGFEEEGRSVEALELVKGSWWRVFGISIVLDLIVAAAGASVSVPLNALAKRADNGPLSLSGDVLGEAITYSFGALSATLLYFDLRSREDQQGSETG